MGTLVADAQPFAQLELEGHPLGVHFADAGNPHAVLFVPDVLDADPERTNTVSPVKTAANATIAMGGGTIAAR
jgi:diaminopimelate epimerase